MYIIITVMDNYIILLTPILIPRTLCMLSDERHYTKNNLNEMILLSGSYHAILYV